MRTWLWGAPALLLLSGVCCSINSSSAQDLKVEFGSHGLERLSYEGQVLEDLSRWPDDEFHIWHMKCYDLNGKTVTTGQYGWGENNRGRSWNSASHTWTYSFDWGTIQTTYLQRGDTLDVRVTERNKADSGVVLDGASVFPLTLHPVGKQFDAAHIGDGVESPGVILERWNNGEVAAVVLDERKPLYSGFQPGKQGALQVVVSGTRPDALPPLTSSPGRPVKPGESDTYTVSLRFAPSGVEPERLAQDAYKSWMEQWPVTLHWTDRRAIGTMFLASSPQPNSPRSDAFVANPRRYFTDASVNVLDARGLERFQTRILEQAKVAVANLQRLDAQGVITWDIEGEENPQDTSYVCAPDQIAQVAPEMETLVSGSRQYAGMKLDDAYFKTIRDAGFRVGVCVRPQRFVPGANRSGHQEYLPDAEVAGELKRKMRYAHDRWGATIFYIDSTVRRDGTTLDASILEEAAAAFPDSLLIPEESTERMYRATAPFRTFLFHGDLGTDRSVYRAYPAAFSANLVNDVDPGTLAAHRAELVESVRRGDILMVLVGFWQANNAAVVKIYKEARAQ